MDPHAIVKEMQKYAVVRSETWQGTSARGGPKYQYCEKNGDSKMQDVEMSNNTDVSSLWTRLSNATGSATHGSAIVRLMQKHLLENIDNIPLDQIELMARRCN